MKAFPLLSSASASAAVLSVCLGLSHARNQTRQPTRWSAEAAADADVDSGCFSLFSALKVGYVCGKFDAAAAEM